MVGDIPAGDGKIVNLFLQCRSKRRKTNGTMQNPEEKGYYFSINNDRFGAGIMLEKQYKPERVTYKKTCS